MSEIGANTDPWDIEWKGKPQRGGQDGDRHKPMLRPSKS